MKKSSEVAPEAFEKMLAWLSTDRDAAGLKYEEIRRRLVRIFVYRGCTNSEELADLVFDRVASKIDETVARFEGDPIRHFLAVAGFIYLESRKKPVETELPDVLPVPAEQVGEDDRAACLRTCLAELPPDRRQLVIDYYSLDKRAKIEARQQLAHKLGVTIANLHSKVFRLRQALHECLSRCLATD
jgi:DNA-directed RNA polymerase specialized sigma24 family protein